MTEVTTKESRWPVERLTALWALNEAGLGGFLHAVKTPFSGMIVGGAAIMLVAMIAYSSERRIRAIFKAAIIVMIIKAMVSPFSPLPSYFAVAFQAVAGAVIFSLITNFRLAALVFGIIGLLETSCQKIIFLTVLYGKSIWEAIDVFFNHVVQSFGLTVFNGGFSASYWLIMMYIGSHVVAGFLIGWFAGMLPAATLHIMNNPLAASRKEIWEARFQSEIKKSKKPFWKNTMVRFLLLLAIISAILTLLVPAVNGVDSGLYVIVRAVCVLLFWYFILSPVLMNMLQRYLKHKSGCYSQEIDSILLLFPDFKKYAKILWAETEGKRGLLRCWQFLLVMTVFSLTFNLGETVPTEEPKKL